MTAFLLLRQDLEKAQTHRGKKKLHENLTLANLNSGDKEII